MLDLSDIIISIFGGLVLALTCSHVPVMLESNPPKDERYAHHLATKELRTFLKKYSWLFGILFTVIMLTVLSTS